MIRNPGISPSIVAMLYSMGLSRHMHGECMRREQSLIGILKAIGPCASSLCSLRLWEVALRPMGQKGGGDTFCLRISLILEQSPYSKPVCWSL